MQRGARPGPNACSRSVAAIDSELYYGDKGSDPKEQKVFLERDPAATRKCWRVVFLPHSPYGVWCSYTSTVDTCCLRQ